MNEMKILRTNLTNINKDLEKIEENYSTASTAKEKEICMKQYTKKEAERDEILAVLDEADGSILNLEKYVGYGMNVKDNLLKLWQIANWGNKKRIQDMMFFNGIIMERSYGSYQRSFDISGVDADKIKAKYVDGVLRLTLPKLEQRLPEGRRLEIE